MMTVHPAMNSVSFWKLVLGKYIFKIRCNFVTLSALQKTLVEFFIAWGFGIENLRGFSVNFLWSPFPKKQSTKTPRKIRGFFAEQTLGRKLTKIRGLFVLHLF